MTLDGRINSRLYVIFQNLLSSTHTNSVTKLVADRRIENIVSEMDALTGTNSTMMMTNIVDTKRKIGHIKVI